MENKENIEEENKTINVRHTISAEETFTLAKDVFDLRCLLKNIYSNRAVIARRLNMLTLSLSAVLCLAYTAFVLFSAFTNKLALQSEIVLFSLLGVYFVLLAVLITVYFCGERTSAKNVKRVKKTLKIFKILVRLTTLAVSVAAIAVSSGESSPAGVAVNILIIVFSVIMLILQILPLLFGGMGKLARWLLSPVKVKRLFSAVVLEWYELAVTDAAPSGTVKKVSKKYFDEIGVLIDNKLLPALGKKYINTIKPAALLAIVESCSVDEKPIAEGVLKNVFEYSTGCGYVTFDPCKDLNFEGSVEEEVKPPKPTMKDRLLNMGKKIGKSALEKYIRSSTEESD